MRVSAPAKINVWLAVGPRRGDGYHEIASVMQAVSLADELTIEPSAATTLDVEPAGSAPEDESNLIVKAVRAITAATGATTGAAIRVRKVIPSAAGLAGGSADAAATLVGLNELWGSGMSKKALERLGSSIGADVAFCVRGGTATARSIGDDLSPLSVRTPLWWVLASFGGTKSSTAAVYEEFDRQGGPGLGDPYELVDALARGDLDSIAGSLRNDLLAPAIAQGATVADGGARLVAAGALGAMLTGAGPAWCGLARDEQHAREIASSAGATWAHVVQSVGYGARVER